jgi:amidase
MESAALASVLMLAREIQARRVGCLELLDLFVCRAEAFNKEINATVTWRLAKARSHAQRADDAVAKGESWGPLHGIPMTVKESCDVEGLPTTFGNPRLQRTSHARTLSPSSAFRAPVR